MPQSAKSPTPFGESTASTGRLGQDERSECKPDRAQRSRDERSECKPDAERKRDSAQPQERAQPSIDQSKEVPMNDSKSTVRYLGCRSLPDGGRGFDFSFAHGSAKPTMITIEAPMAFFQGPDRIAIQEALGICYEP